MFFFGLFLSLITRDLFWAEKQIKKIRNTEKDRVVICPLPNPNPFVESLFKKFKVLSFPGGVRLRKWALIIAFLPAAFFCLTLLVLEIFFPVLLKERALSLFLIVVCPFISKEILFYVCGQSLLINIKYNNGSH